MVTLLLDSTRLEVALSLTERSLAFHKGNVLIERSTIAKVQLTDDAWTWLRGVPSPGTRIPGVVAMGTWKSAGGSDFAVIRRHRSAVVIDLDGHPDFERVVITTSHGVALMKALQLEEVEEEPVDVTELATDAPTAPITIPRRTPKPAGD
ncbi:MAG: hypothetical protein QM611_06220 [Microbacterium sp.]|uniref:hypothetical protein n=1 Tax=Microbacterium sp. TaxID=51671 RepID=UPI0039E67CFA